MYTIYIKKNNIDKDPNTLGYMVSWWEIPFAILFENFNIKRIGRD